MIKKSNYQLWCIKMKKRLGQGYVDLKKQTIQELQELIERQNKLLRNRYFTEKLPDRGNKIVHFLKELECELKKRQEKYDFTCQLLSELTLKESNSEYIEWEQGKSIGSLKSDLVKQLDSDDEEYLNDSEIDPLQLIACHSGLPEQMRLNSTAAKKKESEHNANYCNKICAKYDTAHEVKERYKPNQFKNNSADIVFLSSENLKKRLGDKWEVTQATPPVFTMNGTKAISLFDSLKLQKEQAEKLKSAEKNYAAEKLTHSLLIKMGGKMPEKNTEEYRNNEYNFDDEENESNEENYE